MCSLKDCLVSWLNCHKNYVSFEKCFFARKYAWFLNNRASSLTRDFAACFQKKGEYSKFIVILKSKLIYKSSVIRITSPKKPLTTVLWTKCILKWHTRFEWNFNSEMYSTGGTEGGVFTWKLIFLFFAHGAEFSNFQVSFDFSHF